jgi:hypothetical protein
MDDFVAHIDRRAIFFDRALDDDDCAVDACAKAARGGDQQVEQRQGIGCALRRILCDG